ncbi:Mut7-C RNAse domain-containing protein [Pelagophyceae sp. CCMP2097]|nr:Mut7-C RNAse domain-containing protein [Pelagophyceae sp. CCMP2097]
MDCLLRRTEAFALDAGVGRVIVCGDFNSLPQSRAMRLCLDGAARLEPHYAADVPRRPAGAGGHSLVIVDNNLAKICKWLRLVGVDAELETAEEAQARAAGGAIALVARAKAGGRLLVTSSRTLVARRECAALPCAFIPSMMDADAAFAHVICAAQIDVDGSRALSRCVLCNGAIRVLGAAAAAAARVGAAVPQDAATALSECSGCGQRFWFNDDGDSSAARAQQLADRLVRVAIQARADAGAAADDGSDALLRGLAAGARHGLGLRSAHPVGGGVSNYCPDFHGQLDYVLYSRATWALARRRRLPTTAELRAALRGAFLPTCEWPSDHVAVVVDLAPTEAPTESTDAAALGDARQCES